MGPPQSLLCGEEEKPRYWWNFLLAENFTCILRFDDVPSGFLHNFPPCIPFFPLEKYFKILQKNT